MRDIGCRGYLLKRSTGPVMLAEATDQVAKGAMHINPAFKDKLLYDVMKELVQTDNNNSELQLSAQ